MAGFDAAHLHGVGDGNSDDRSALPDGSLFVYSPIRLNPELRDALDAIGPVRHIVAPSLYHHLFVGDFAAAYPSARTYAAPGLDEKRKDFEFDEILGDELDPSWRSALSAQRLDGCAFGEVLFFHEPSRTLISADLVENFQTSNHWPTRAYLRAAGIYGLRLQGDEDAHGDHA